MRLLALTFLVFLLTISALQTSAQDDPLPNLTGSWKINEAQSDDPAAAMGPAMGGRQREGGKPGGGGGGGRGGGGGGRGGGGGGAGGRGGQQGPGNQNSEDAQKGMEQIKRQYASLEIFQEGVELNVTNGLDITQLLYTDGRQMTIWTQHGEADATATWVDRTLEVEWQTRQDGPQRVRRYEISEDGRTLTATEERQLPGQDKVTQLKLVYDRQS